MKLIYNVLLRCPENIMSIDVSWERDRAEALRQCLKVLDYPALLSKPLEDDPE